MSRHLDADYLRLHVALEAFAYWTLRLANEEERMIVKDKTAWKAWVKDHRSSILEHASAGFEANLYNKVMGVYRLSSGRVVPSAFQALGLTLTEQMDGELDGRDIVVHLGLMAPENDEDGPPLDERVAIVRTLLVALLAKTAGYFGAINGWKVGVEGYPIEPHSWWTVHETDREPATSVYVVEQPKPAVEVLSLAGGARSRREPPPREGCNWSAREEPHDVRSTPETGPSAPSLCHQDNRHAGEAQAEFALCLASG